MSTPRWAAMAAVATAATIGLAACSGASGGRTAIGTGSTSKTAGQKVRGGTVTVAWVAATPNFIFPLPPATNSDGYNANLSNPLWPPLAY